MDTHVCPWWLGYFLASPLRKLIQDPDTILKPYLREGMQILEVGPGMGFFTLPMARLIGPRGKIFALDVQKKMLNSLKRRAEKRGLIDRIEPRLCPNSSLGIDDLGGRIDFALAFAVLHEIPNIRSALSEISHSLKTGGTLLISEPNSHVSAEEFQKTVNMAKDSGLSEISAPIIKRSRSILMSKSK